MNISILSSDVSTSKIDILDDQKIDSQSFINLATKLWRQFRYRDAELVLENAASRYPLRADIRDLSDRIKADRATLYEIRQNRLSSVHFHIDSIVNKSITKDKIRDVEIRGWVRVTKNGARLIVEQEGKTDEILEIGISRNDVVGYLKKKGVFDCVKECGFSFRADLSANLKISLLQDSDILPFVQIRSKRILQVLEGADGWLFLNNDTNRSADIFTGKMPASSNMAKSWGDFALRSKMKLDSLNIESCFVISPSKEDVFPEFYPLKPASFSILDVVRTGIFLNNVSISCPMQRLRQDVDSYYKTCLLYTSPSPRD